MELDRKNVKKILMIITFAICIYLGLNNLNNVTKAIFDFIGVILPFIIGICIAFIINVLLKVIENQWCKIFKRCKSNLVNKLKRPLCICLSFILVISGIFILLFMIIPEIGRTISEIARMIPYYVSRIDKWYSELSNELANINVNLPELNIEWKTAWDNIINFLTEGALNLFDKTIGITTSIFSGVFMIIISTIFSIYILFNKENLGRQIKKLMYAYLQEEKADRFFEIMSMADRIFSKFVIGQLTEAIIIGVLCFLGMSMLSMPYKTMISALIGFTALIPLVGAFLGTAVGAFMILMVSPIKAVVFVIFIILLQQIEGNIIYPRVVGKSVGLPGMWVLVAITVGGSVSGIAGMLVSVPICSLLYALLRESVNKRLVLKGAPYRNEDDGIEETK